MTKSKVVRMSFGDMVKKMWGYKYGILDLVTNGDKNLAHTGAAVYYLGGGWWRVSGYAWDGHDINI